MKRLLCIASALLWAALWGPAGAQEQDEVFSVRRFLLALGNNDGGANRVTLHYAATDAQTVARVFENLGGVDPEDRLLLLDAGPAALRQSLGELEGRIAAAAREHSRVELILYYSGHSDDQGLRLGEELLSYTDLRAAVNAVSADVRIIILDSCASGAFTRLKGGRRRPPFLMDASAKMKGHAFLTSSSHDEAAQESDRIRGSFFTHALVTGLRGAADVTQDRRVTLNEAYQFAFHTTLARTEGTLSGPQHPGYDIQMVGAGDLVMTDLRTSSAGLVLTESVQGRLHVRDAQDALVVELHKPQGRHIELGLDAGDYRVFLDHDGRYYTAAIHLPEEGLTRLEMADLIPMTPEATAARGEFPPTPEATIEETQVLHRDFTASLWPGMSTAGPEAERTVSDISLNLTLGRNAGVNGFEIGYVGNWNLGNVDGLQIAGGLNLVEGDLEGAQFSGLINRVRGDVRAIQWAGLANSIGGAFQGMQWGALNVVEGDVGFFQGAGLASISLGRCEGVQASGLGNYAPSLRGLQLSVVNVSGHAEGAQIGVVNVARTVSGAQIGVLNVAQDVAGAPVGVLSLVQRGRHRPAVWHTDAGGPMVGVQLGNRSIYSIFAGGVESPGENERWLAGFGWGAHVPLSGSVFGTVEALSYYIFEDEREGDQRSDRDLHLLNKGRVGFGWRIAPRLALTAGATVNVFTSRRNDGGDLVGGDLWHDEKSDRTWVRVWPGYYVGIQF